MLKEGAMSDPKKLLRRAKLAIGTSAAVRAVRERQQLYHLRQLLRQASGETAWDAKQLAGRLDERRPDRLPLPERPTVAVFGAEDWELNGLWPSFGRVADMRFFAYSRLAKKHGIPSVTKEHRDALCRAYLAEVDALMAQGPLHAVFFYADGEVMSPELFRELGRRRVWSVLMGLDDKHRYWRRRHHGVVVGQERVASDVDLYWTTWRTGADIIAAQGGTPWYAPEAADPDFHHPCDVERDLDVVFVGQRYGRRAALVEHLRKRGIRVSAFGRGWDGGYVTFEQSVELFSRAKVVLGLGDTGAMRGLQALKGRDFEAPMSGAVYLTSYNPELCDFWRIGEEILCWSSFENCEETLRWILPRPDVQESIRAAALARARRDHTWDVRLREMLAVLRGEPGGQVSN